MFTFNRGSWEDGSPLPEWEENEDYVGYRKRIGYSDGKTSFGDPHGGNLEIFESSSGDSFYASICPSGGACYAVYLPDFPSFMMFIRDYAAAFASEATNVTQQQIWELLEKMFQVEHGHSAHAICPQCDPAAWEAREKRRNKL